MPMESVFGWIAHYGYVEGFGAMSFPTSSCVSLACPAHIR
jgi:hypothetical protein